MSTTIEQLPIGQLKPAKDNARRDVGDVAELAASIKAMGLLEPIVATRQNGHHLIVCGARRFAAAKQAGLTDVPVIVREFSEAERVEAMLIENLQRESLAPLEEAEAYSRLVELGHTQRKLAERVGRSQSHVSKRLALLELPAKARKELDSGGITLEDAQALARLTEFPQRLTHALNEGHRYRSIPRAVEAELEDLKLEQDLEKKRKSLKASGLRVLELKNDNYGWPKLPSGTVEVSSGSWDGIAMEPNAHGKLDCGAVALDPRSARVIHLCTKPGNHPNEARGRAVASAAKQSAPEAEKERAREERAKEKQRMLRAREANIEIGRTLAKKLAAPRIDLANMRILAELFVWQNAGDLGQRGLRFVDESSQSVITKKDGSVSRIVHVSTETAAAELVRKRLAQAKSAEEIMGVLLQLLLAAVLADKEAVPHSQRAGWVKGLDSYYDGVGYRCKVAYDGLTKLAGKHGLSVPKSRRR